MQNPYGCYPTSIQFCSNNEIKLALWRKNRHQGFGCDKAEQNNEQRPKKKEGRQSTAVDSNSKNMPCNLEHTPF